MLIEIKLLKERFGTEKKQLNIFKKKEKFIKLKSLKASLIKRRYPYTFMGIGMIFAEVHIYPLQEK